LRVATASCAPRLGKRPAAPDPIVEEEVQTITSLGRPWNVIVWDDPVNLMSYVVYVFQKLFGFSTEQAAQHMMEVHNDGRSMVANADREKAEFYVSRLHGYGLQATLEQSQGD
jgi:ATP-dependent Clp protease adaptor protein ClpS